MDSTRLRQLPESVWREALSFVAELTCAYDADSLVDMLFTRVSELIPCDRGVAFLEMREGVPWGLRGPDFFPTVAHDFNYHYARIAPMWPGTFGPALRPVRWDSFGDIEYNVDFNHPWRISHSIALVFRNPISGHDQVLALHRSPEAPPFGSAERDMTAALASLIPSIYSLWTIAVPSPVGSPPTSCDTPVEPQGLELLSPRELEVSRLLCERLSLPQIAELLNLSPRTVESHVAHIYTKMGVKRRIDLVRKLRRPDRSASHHPGTSARSGSDE